MARMVHCAKLNKEAEGLERPPYPGELGQRIFDSISKEAWDLWVKQQTILMNEHRLTPIDPEHRKFLQQQMEEFLFSGGSEMPVGFTPKI